MLKWILRRGKTIEAAISLLDPLRAKGGRSMDRKSSGYVPDFIKGMYLRYYRMAILTKDSEAEEYWYQRVFHNMKTASNICREINQDLTRDQNFRLSTLTKRELEDISELEDSEALEVTTLRSWFETIIKNFQSENGADFDIDRHLLRILLLSHYTVVSGLDYILDSSDTGDLGKLHRFACEMRDRGVFSKDSLRKYIFEKFNVKRYVVDKEVVFIQDLVKKLTSSGGTE